MTATQTPRPTFATAAWDGVPAPGVELRRDEATTPQPVAAASPNAVPAALGEACKPRLDALGGAQPDNSETACPAVSTPPSPELRGAGLSTPSPAVTGVGQQEMASDDLRAGTGGLPLAGHLRASAGALPPSPALRGEGGLSPTDDAAWIRAHVWTQAMRKTFAGVPGFYTSCACQYGLTHWCKTGRHELCHRGTPNYSQATVICRRNGDPAHFAAPFEHLANIGATGPLQTASALVWYADRICRWICDCTDCGHHELHDDYDPDLEGERDIVDLHLTEPGTPLPAPRNGQLELPLAVQLDLFSEAS